MVRRVKNRDSLNFGTLLPAALSVAENSMRLLSICALVNQLMKLLF